MENYLYVLDQILNYDENFYEINEHYEKFNITKTSLKLWMLLITIKKNIIMYDSKRWGKFIKRNLDNHVRYFNEIIILDTVQPILQWVF